MNFWSKRIKNNKNIADALEVDEDKIKALKDNRLEIKGETLNKTLKVIEAEKINKAIKENEIWKWVQDTNFKEKREEFGYKTQKEVAKKVKCDSSIICNLENHKEQFKRVSPKLIDVYNFYTNDFNKKYKKTYKSDKTREPINKDNRHIWKWYKNTDIRALRLSLGYKTLYDLVDKIGVSQSCLSDLELKRCKTINKTMINAYNFYNNNQVAVEEAKDDIYVWYKSIEDLKEYRRNFGYSLNKFMSALSLSYDQARAFERHEYKSATPVVMRIYNFYHNEKNRLSKIDWEPNENNVFVKQENTASKLEIIKDEKEEIQKLLYRIEYLEKINEKYEKLIDKLVDRL